MKNLFLLIIFGNFISLQAQDPKIIHYLYPDFIMDIENQYGRTFTEAITINGIKDLNSLTELDSTVILVNVRDISKEYIYHGDYTVYIQYSEKKWFSVFYHDFEIITQGFIIVTDEKTSIIDSTFITIPWPPYDHTIHVNHWLKSSKDGKWIYYTYNQSGIREENEVVYKMGEIIPSNKK